MASQVEEFFRKNEKSRTLAHKAKELLGKRFPRSSIWFSYDYDLDIKKELVWIVISTKMTYEEAYQLLEEFDEWWYPELKKAGGKLAITIKAKEYF